MAGFLVVQTDFGLQDGAVNAMYGVAYQVDPALNINNLTHEIDPYNIHDASYRLLQAATYWPAGTVFVSVVDPGVGSTRRSVVAELKDGQYVITPDNGTLTYLAQYVGIKEVRQIDEETPILLFDEPLANLDPQTGYEAIQMIDQLYQSQKFTTIIIEHRLEEVLAAPIDRVILMDEGMIIADMTPTELLKSDLLAKYGIREPLYLTALKRVGISLTDFSELTQVDSLVSPEISAALAKAQGTFRLPAEKKVPLLTLNKVSFGFGAELVIKDIDLTLYQGEMVSLVGHNGAGKSTLSNLITGFHSLQTGGLLWKNHSIAEESIKERADKIGYVLQNSSQMLSKNLIFDEVALGLENRGIDSEIIQAKVLDTLKVCGLYEFRNWPISALSHGQKRRVAIASILVLEPELLILDEPTAGQDYYHYNEMMVFLRQLNQQGITILMITHDMHLMLEHTRRTLVLKDGQIIADKTPADVLSSAELVASASLRETSLYRLAKNNHLTDAAGFVSAFIQHEEGTDGE